MFIYHDECDIICIRIGDLIHIFGWTKKYKLRIKRIIEDPLQDTIYS